MSADPRSHRRYRTWRVAVRRHHATLGEPCVLCGDPVDYSLAYPHPASWSLEHDEKLDRGGHVMPDNPKAAHLRCQSVQGGRYVTGKRKLGISARDW